MNQIRVLLADDHRIVANGIERLLREDFDLVEVVHDGSELLEAAVRTCPDVIVSDISMPGISGLDAIVRLKADVPTAKFVFLTVHHNLAYVEEALQAGALGYVLKQSAVEELILAVRAAAAGRTFISTELAGEWLLAKKSGSTGPYEPLRQLSLRKREILRLLAEGHSAKEIAGRLDISQRTVESHKYRIMQILDVANSAELIRFALQHGLGD